MKNQFVKKMLIAAAAFLFAFTGCCAALAESYTGQTIRLLRYEGNVEIADAEGQPRFVMENARFASGESMQTGEESYASVSLDTDRIMTLDQLSQVAFFQEGDHMTLNLK